MKPIVEAGDIQPFNKDTRHKIAACAALGLSYWSDHPTKGCIWAVDDNQRAHVVRWYRKTDQAALQQPYATYRMRDYSKIGVAFKTVECMTDSAPRVHFEAV